MYMSPELLCYLQQLNGCLHSQNQQIKEMNGFIQQIVKEVNQLKEKSAQPTVISLKYSQHDAENPGTHVYQGNSVI